MWAMNKDGTNQRVLFAIPSGAEPGRWSPDRTRILAYKSGINILPVDGGALRQVLSNTPAVGWADWSPDGTQLVYHRGPELWVAQIDGSNPHKLAGPFNELFTPGPAWTCTRWICGTRACLPCGNASARSLLKGSS